VFALLITQAFLASRSQATVQPCRNYMSLQEKNYKSSKNTAWWPATTVGMIPGDSRHGRTGGVGETKEERERVPFCTLLAAGMHRGGRNLTGKVAARSLFRRGRQAAALRMGEGRDNRTRRVAGQSGPQARGAGARRRRRCAEPRRPASWWRFQRRDEGVRGDDWRAGRRGRERAGSAYRERALV